MEKTSIRYIRCDTSIIGGPVWHDDGVMKLYFYFLCKASHNEYFWHGIRLMPGDLPMSDRSAANELEWSRNKLYRKLKQLEETGLITVRATSMGTLIHIVEWCQSGATNGSKAGLPWFQSGSTGFKVEQEHFQNDTGGSSNTEPGWFRSESESGSAVKPNQYSNNNNNNQPEPEGFSKLWIAYPSERRTRRYEAAALFRQALEQGATLQSMLDALTVDKNSYDWCKENGQYIPGIVKWLQKENWRNHVKHEPAEEEERWRSR